jgi:HPt (histidine-containing phosphotransfer) domain-containing protein
MNHEVPTEPVPARPVLTPVGLQLLTEDVGTETARAFLIAYLALLAGRADAIVDKLAAGDVVGALKAVSSLHATSSMAGALRLEDYCQSLQRQLSAGRIPNAGAVRVELDENVSLLSSAIPELLSTPADGLDDGS